MQETFNSSNQNIVYPKQTPQIDKHYAVGVSGHIACIVQDEGTKEQYLFMAGGANFPEVPAADKGQKFCYQEVYAYRLSEEGSKWELLGQLPEKLAYAAFTKRANALYIAGGENENGQLDRFFRLSMQDKHLLCEELPKLPHKRSGANLVNFGERFYLIGGNEDGEMVNSMYSWAKGEESWRSEESYPHSPYLKTLSVANKEYIFTWGAFPHEEYGNSEEFLNSSYLHKYDPRQGKWISDAIDSDEIAALPCFGGGLMYYNAEQDDIVLLGGVNAERFLPALRRGDLMAKAMAEGNDSLLAEYRKQGRAYMTASPEWHAFNKKAYRYDAKLFFECTMTNPAIARADAVLVPLVGKVLILGGEIKPGIRSTEINLVSLG